VNCHFILITSVRSRIDLQLGTLTVKYMILSFPVNVLFFYRTQIVSSDYNNSINILDIAHRLLTIIKFPTYNLILYFPRIIVKLKNIKIYFIKLVSLNAHGEFKVKQFNLYIILKRFSNV